MEVVCGASIMNCAKENTMKSGLNLNKLTVFSRFLCMFFLPLKTTEKSLNAICHFTKAKLSSWNIRPVLVDIKLQKSQLLILAIAKSIVQDILTSSLCDLKLSQPPKTQLVGDDPSGFRHVYISRPLGPPECDQAPRSSPLDQVLDQNQSFIVLVYGGMLYIQCVVVAHGICWRLSANCPFPERSWTADQYKKLLRSQMISAKLVFKHPA